MNGDGSQAFLHLDIKMRYTLKGLDVSTVITWK